MHEEDGAFVALNGKGEPFRAVKGDDKYMPFSCISTPFYSTERFAKNKLSASLFTDRSIYRPSQTVHVGGFVYREQRDTVNVAENENLNVIMKDGSKVLQKISVKTDSFGGYSADFTLPVSLTGNNVVLIVDNVGKKTKRLVVKKVTVEEYKLPEFRVEIDSVKEHYTWGDSIVGKSCYILRNACCECQGSCYFRRLQ